GEWGDGESTLVRRNTTVERSGEPVTLTSQQAEHAKRAAQGEMGRWGEESRGGSVGRGRKKEFSSCFLRFLRFLRSPRSLRCLIPHAQLPITFTHLLSKP
ncbi:MAG: hypothetical protein WBA41_02845, partial [Rivularia sp. (in: cyanobacteria)]